MRERVLKLTGWFGCLIFFLCCVTSAWAQLKADKQDSLLLLQFHEELIQKGWPVLWNTNQNVAGWTGVSLDPVNGKVTGLDISGDRISPPFQTDSLPSAIGLLQSLNSLKDLWLSVLGIKYLPAEIGNLQHLESLGLGYNRLAEIPPEINRLVHLKLLFLNNNKLTGLPDLSALTQLENLTLSANQTLTELPPATFALRNLTRLDISFTLINELPTQISNLTALEVLDADGAALSNLPASIGALQMLRDLQLSHNQLTFLPEEVGDLVNLTNLDLTHNLLTVLPTSFRQLINLTQIRFSDNRLTQFPSSLAGLTQLRNIFGERNQMMGTIPDAVFNTTGLRLFLDDNELSGRLAIDPGNLPQRLFLTNNRFTLNDIIEQYNDFDPANNTIIEFQPQQKIGTFCTRYPQAGESVTISIDNYTPVSGAVFAWHRIATLAEGNPVKVSDQQVLNFTSFDPAVNSGIYYCKVTHPGLPGLNLESNRIRVITEDAAPTLVLNDVVFRQGNTTAVTANGIDDFTAKEDLSYTWPQQTTHLRFEVDPSFPLESRRLIYALDPIWVGTDTVTVMVADENSSSSEATFTVTVLPSENQAPQVSMPPIYMNIFQDITLPCVPGTSGCSAFYPFVSKTLLKHFVKDDFTSIDNLEYGILESDPITGVITDKVTIKFGLQPEGVVMDATVFAYQDTTITVTLEVTDREGGIRQQQIQFLGLGAQPNRSPLINAIPDQVILKGKAQFPVLNLNEFVEDDYVARENIIWRASAMPSLSLVLEDSISRVTPVYPDSSYTGTIAYFASEETNFLRESRFTVTYTIIDGITISGSVKDRLDQPLAGVEFIGFPELVLSDASGHYECGVPPGWSGKVYPGLLNYSFEPDTITYTDVQVIQTEQNYSGRYIGPVTIVGVITSTEGGEPLPDVRLEGFPETIITDNLGQYSVTLPIGWGGKVYPVLEDYLFQPDTVIYNNLDIPQVVQDYVGMFNGTTRYAVYGTVVDIRQGNPLAGVLLEGFPDVVITDLAGRYEAKVPNAWSGTITPLLQDFVFEPDSREYQNVTSSRQDQNYSATYVGDYKIGGTIITTEGEPVSDVVLIGFPSETTTDENGIYLAQVPYNWSGIVVPELNDRRFSPGERFYEVLTQDLLEENYIVEVTTSLLSDKELSMLKIFPNPSNGIVNFNLSGYTYKSGQLVIFNGLGQALDHQELIPGVNQYSWEITNIEGSVKLQQGIYFARLYLDAELTTTMKFTITN
ncbi:leucine-rich repeat domain-containing protein [Fulvivirga sp. M361]|uniref:leucine-rich repeat domain-containing protein n=1 Tax=Fulvivirga sp. M361 TaxID=2594266 RepID=UPI00162A60B6|nr:leucine-rich repeat domain-containing protein [Fulvivirga sp. M361]